MRLSVLDQSPIRAGGTARQTLAETVRLAQAAEGFGYCRYWLAEHHNTGSFASASPEIMIAHVANATRRIRVGSGGVLLGHYSPLKVAENFRMLESLFPGRIDLGIGRAPGADGKTAEALRNGPGWRADQFPQQVQLLMDLLTDSHLSDSQRGDHPYAGIRAVPPAPTFPEIWLLGSTDQSAACAAHFGCGYSAAHFINPHGGESVMAAYRESFRPSNIMGRASGSAAVFAICADTEEKAKKLALSRDLWRVRLEQGIHDAIPSVEEALAHPYSEAEKHWIERNRRRYFVGAPEQLQAQLSALAESYGVDELVILSICHDPDDRLRSYRLLAEAFALSRPAEAAQ